MNKDNKPAYYIVWNEAKTEGFITKDKQIAYEARKGSESNCYTEDGEASRLAITFCETWGGGNCKIEEIYNFEN